MAIHRVFMGWDQPSLPAAADHLLSRFSACEGNSLEDTIVAVPGGRAGRRLEEILVHKAQSTQAGWIPPRIMTVGKLPEQLYVAKLPFADELAQQLAWIEALKTVEYDELANLISALPADDDLAAWLALGEMLARLHRELAADGLDFNSVADCGLRIEGFQEQARWLALSEIQRGYLAVLDSLGLWDLQTARLFAIREAECRTDVRVVLVGTVDLNNAQRLMLDQIADRVTALIFAPRELADRFDEHGCLKPDAWQDASLDLSDNQMEVVDGPGDQAAAVVRWMAGLEGRFAAEEITVGVPSEDVIPYLEQQLEACGIPARYGVGRPISRTGPYRLLNVAADYLESGRFPELAALVRHPAIDSWLADEATRGDWLTEMDAYYSSRLVAVLNKRKLAGTKHGSALEDVCRAVEGLLERLRGAARRPLSDWSEPIVELLLAVFGCATLDPNVDAQRTVLLACEKIHAVLRKYQSLHDYSRLEPSVTGAEALRLVLRGAQGESVAAKAERDAVELLGWLELPLDDAPALVVTQFNEGTVPASVNADLFLPNQLRHELGIEDNDRRWARDVYALSAIVASRPEVKLISGRRTADKDPLRPSRLLFACDDQTIASRAIKFFAERESLSDPNILPGGIRPGQAVPKLETPLPEPLAAPVTAMRVTEFRDYLACPYRYYLRHRLKLAEMADSDRELDGRAFGSLAHDVLKEFGETPVAESTDAVRIAAWLSESLDRNVARQFGEAPLAAVRVQVEQLRLRLARFADWQAEWREQGWRIEHVEIEPANGNASLIVDRTPMILHGRIDRIDWNEESGEHLVFDYKTSDSAKTPEATHRKKGQWIDLQLPLYKYLTMAMGIEGPIQLGYIVLPKDTAKTGPLLAEWSDDDLSSAIGVAEDVVRSVRAQSFWPPASPPPDFSEQFAAICRDNQLGAPQSSNGAEGGGQ